MKRFLFNHLIPETITQIFSNISHINPCIGSRFPQDYSGFVLKEVHTPGWFCTKLAFRLTSLFFSSNLTQQLPLVIIFFWEFEMSKIFATCLYHRRTMGMYWNTSPEAIFRPQGANCQGGCIFQFILNRGSVFLFFSRVGVYWKLPFKQLGCIDSIYKGKVHRKKVKKN